MILYEIIHPHYSHDRKKKIFSPLLLTSDKSESQKKTEKLKSQTDFKRLMIVSYFNVNHSCPCVCFVLKFLFFYRNNLISNWLSKSNFTNREVANRERAGKKHEMLKIWRKVREEEEEQEKRVRVFYLLFLFVAR